MSIDEQLSVVIPIGPNDPSWHSLLKDLSSLGPNLEIILAACQVKPANIKCVDNIKWIQTKQGRATQLNAGASHATRKFIWFLHADTRFTEDIFLELSAFIKANNNHLAFFKLKFANDASRLTHFNALAANIRSTFFGLPFGDQGFLMKKKVFNQLNGFDEKISLGEDLDFIIRLHAAKIPLQELSFYLMTSARRYHQNGWLKTTVRHIWLTWQLTQQAKQRLEVKS